MPEENKVRELSVAEKAALAVFEGVTDRTNDWPESARWTPAKVLEELKYLREAVQALNRLMPPVTPLGGGPLGAALFGVGPGDLQAMTMPSAGVPWTVVRDELVKEEKHVAKEAMEVQAESPEDVPTPARPFAGVLKPGDPNAGPSTHLPYYTEHRRTVSATAADGKLTTLHLWCLQGEPTDTIWTTLAQVTEITPLGHKLELLSGRKFQRVKAPPGCAGEWHWYEYIDPAAPAAPAAAPRSVVLPDNDWPSLPTGRCLTWDATPVKLTYKLKQGYVRRLAGTAPPHSLSEYLTGLHTPLGEVVQQGGRRFVCVGADLWGWPRWDEDEVKPRDSTTPKPAPEELAVDKAHPEPVRTPRTVQGKVDGQQRKAHVWCIQGRPTVGMVHALLAAVDEPPPPAIVTVEGRTFRRVPEHIGHRDAPNWYEEPVPGPELEDVSVLVSVARKRTGKTRYAYVRKFKGTRLSRDVRLVLTNARDAKSMSTGDHRHVEGRCFRHDGWDEEGNLQWVEIVPPQGIPTAVVSPPRKLDPTLHTVSYYPSGNDNDPTGRKWAYVRVFEGESVEPKMGELIASKFLYTEGMTTQWGQRRFRRAGAHPNTKDPIWEEYDLFRFAPSHYDPLLWPVSFYPCGTDDDTPGVKRAYVRTLAGSAREQELGKSLAVYAAEMREGEERVVRTRRFRRTGVNEKYPLLTEVSDG